MQILEVHLFEKKPIIQLVRGAKKQIPEPLVYNKLNLIVTGPPLNAKPLSILTILPFYAF